MVRGTITSADADGDTRSYSGPATSVKGGAVTLDAATGAFTYTPTAAAREQATQTPGVDTDMFTVTVSDGHGGSTPVQVTVTIAPDVVTTESTPGIPISGVIAAPGGTLYQVTASFPGGDPSAVVTRVSVLTPDGRVLVTTADLGGFPSLPIARPDGSLLVTSTDPLGAKTTFVSVDPTGTVTPILNVDTSTVGAPVVAANGTVYVLTAAPNGSNGATYTVVAIAGDVGRTYQLQGNAAGSPVVAPDGTAYVPVLSVSTFEETSVLVVRPDGSSFTTAPVDGTGARCSPSRRTGRGIS